MSFGSERHPRRPVMDEIANLIARSGRSVAQP